MNGETKKTGLVLEGGAMRGLFSAGVLDVFMENDITFDGAVKQLNRVVKSDPNGRPEVEVLAFGTSEKVGTNEK